MMMVPPAMPIPVPTTIRKVVLTREKGLPIRPSIKPVAVVRLPMEAAEVIIIITVEGVVLI